MKALKIRACLLTAVSIACLSTTVSIVMGQTVSADFLQAAAVSAARTARFQPVSVSNKPVRISGIIKYDFVLE